MCGEEGNKQDKERKSETLQLMTIMAESHVPVKTEYIWRPQGVASFLCVRGRG